MALTKAIISLADHIKINCIAEGIETADDAEFCIASNIHAMQGYYYYKPLTMGDFVAVLASQVEQSQKLA